MPYALTVDQRRSSGSADRVETALAKLAGVPTLLAFERTVGDEFQGLLDDPASVVDATLELVRDGGWHIGIGAGAVEHPLPSSTRSARGPAFELARDAVEAAKHRPQHVAVRGGHATAAAEAEAVLSLVAAVVQRRSDAAWEVIDLQSTGRSAADAAARLGISRQAVGQRLAVGLWQQEQAVRPVLARLLAGADGR